MIELQRSLQIAAHRVWNHMYDAARLGLFMSEETITETTLLFLARRYHSQRLAIKAYTKKEESKLGADWAWCFMQGTRAVAMRIQAKRLYSGAKYNALRPTGGQINRLINQSGSNHHPVFVFYNDGIQTPRFLQASPQRTIRCCSFFCDQVWGCMISRAQTVRRVGSNNMADLLPVSMPWHCLLCPRSAFRSPTGAAPTLPDLVAENLASMFRMESSPDEIIDITPSEPPEWVSFVQNWSQQTESTLSDGVVAPADARIESYLEEHDLAGLTLFESRPAEIR